MGRYYDYRVVVKPKPEMLDYWSRIHEDHPYGWLRDKTYPGVSALYECSDTPYVDDIEYLEFRGNSKYTEAVELLPILDTLDDWLIIVHDGSHEQMTCIVKENTSIVVKDEFFDLRGGVLVVHNRKYLDSDDEVLDIHSNDLPLIKITNGKVITLVGGVDLNEIPVV